MEHGYSGQRCRAVVIGASAGGLDALTALLPRLPKDFPPVVVVQHLFPGSGGYLVESLDHKCAMTVKEAEEKEALRPGCIYIAPSDYHLLIERDETLSLSIDEKVNHSRPSIDVLFESAAHAYRSDVTGVILTGANRDGADGMRTVKQCGGLTIAQSPNSAECPVMPQAAIDAAVPDHVAPLEDIAKLLVEIGTGFVHRRTPK